MIPEDLKKNKAGGRPSNHSLLISEDEYQWLYAQVSKRSARPVSPKESAKVRSNLESLYDKLILPAAATSPNEGYVLKLNRDELQVINAIVGNTVKSLRDVIIPEYAKRASNSPRLVEAYQTLTMLTELHAKGTRIYAAGSHRRGNGRV